MIFEFVYIANNLQFLDILVCVSSGQCNPYCDKVKFLMHSNDFTVTYSKITMSPIHVNIIVIS